MMEMFDDSLEYPFVVCMQLLLLITISAEQ